MARVEVTRLILLHIDEVGLFDSTDVEGYKKAPFTNSEFERFSKLVCERATDENAVGIDLGEAYLVDVPLKYKGQYYVYRRFGMDSINSELLMTWDRYLERTQRVRKMTAWLKPEQPQEDLREKAVCMDEKSAMDILKEKGIDPPDPAKQQLVIDSLTGKRSYED